MKFIVNADGSVVLRYEPTETEQLLDYLYSIRSQDGYDSDAINALIDTLKEFQPISLH